MMIVVPVRLAAHDRVTQKTSRELTASSLLLASQRRPRAKEIVALRLYLPDALSPAGVIGQVRGEPPAGESGGFWVDLLETIGAVGERIRALVAPPPPARPAHSLHRLTTRYPTSIPVAIESNQTRFAARVIDLSSGGAFVRCRERLDVGSVVVMKLLVPGHEDVVAVNARIVHVTESGWRHAPWSEAGFGLQFVDGDDAFRSQVDRYLERIASAARPAAKSSR
jgi:uncharacterized protein (TIGR02266 family)